MAGLVFDDLAVVVWRDLTIPSHSGKCPGSEVGAGIFLHLISLQILCSALFSADSPRLREGGYVAPCISPAAGLSSCSVVRAACGVLPKACVLSWCQELLQEQAVGE